MTAASPLITNCLISENNNGVMIKGASNPVINNCDFFNNGYSAVNNVNKSFNVDATNCWWGDNSGPTVATNPGGIGGVVTDKVIYSPWKTTGSMNPLIGDVSLNGIIQAYDASLVLQYKVGTLTLSPLQLKVADVSSDGSVTSYDASLILQYVAGINSVFPAEMKSPALASNVVLSFGDITKNADHTYTIPVNVTNGSGSISLDIATAFDVPLIEPVSVTIGKDVADRLFLSNIDKVTGKLMISVAGTEKLPSQAEVANITFKPVGNWVQNTLTTLNINKFLANETDFTPFAIPKTIQIGDVASGISALDSNGKDLLVYPNPVNQTSKVYYHVADNGNQVRISLFDLTGKEVALLVNAMQNAGDYTFRLDQLKQGVYFLKMISGNQNQVQKIIVE